MNKISQLEKMDYADSKVLGYSMMGDSLELQLRNWKDLEIAILLKGVAGIKDLGVIGFDLSHGKISRIHTMIRELKELHEDEEEYYCLELWVADLDDEPLFSTVFQSFENK